MEQKLHRLKESMDHTVLKDLQFTEKNKGNVRKALQLSSLTAAPHIKKQTKKPEKMMAVLSSAACLVLLLGGLTFTLHLFGTTPDHYSGGGSGATNHFMTNKSSASTAHTLLKDTTPKTVEKNAPSLPGATSQAMKAPVELVHFSTFGNRIWLVTTTCVYTSTDQGQTLQPLKTLPSSEFIGAAVGLNNQTLLMNVILKDGSTNFLKTTDGGKTWSSQTNPFKGEGEFSFINDQVGWYFSRVNKDKNGNNVFKLYKTTDGGQHWTDLSGTKAIDQRTMTGSVASFHLKANLEGLTFINSTNGFLYNESYNDSNSLYMYHTNDGGKTWQSINLSLPLAVRQMTGISLQPIHMINQRTGYIILKAHGLGKEKNAFVIYTTSDAGQTWKTSSDVVASKMDVSSTVSADRIFVTDGVEMYVFNHNGHLLSQSQMLFDGKPLRFIGPPTLRMIDDRVGFLNIGAANTSTMYRTGDGGQTWKTVK